jgi:hypothetical protein
VPAPHAVSYRERLTTPWWFWVIAASWALTLGLAYGHAVATAVGVAVGCAAIALAGLGLVRVSAVVTVTETGLTAGAAHLPVDAIGAVAALDAETARHQRGQGADSRAFVLLRGWVPTAVRVSVDDRRDPTPYWYVSTRSPEQLAEALRQVKDHASLTPSTDLPTTDMTGSASSPTLKRKDRDGHV